MREKTADALLASAIKDIEELEALVVMLENINIDTGPTKLASKFREMANLFDRLPLIANDFAVIKRRLRGMLSSDPDRTPKAVSLRDFAAVEVDGRESTDEKRRETQRGLGIPLPKKE